MVKHFNQQNPGRPFIAGSIRFAFIACGITITSVAVDIVQAEDTPARLPGLTMRVYEVGQDMHQVPRLVEGQAPNINRPLHAIDLRDTDFGFSDFFYVEIDGYLRVDRPGRYTFHLSSDDGSLLMIDGETVIDHDGLHALETASANVNLDAGVHDIEIRYFENVADAALRLEWTPPGQRDPEPIPAALFSSDDQVRMTSPGKKKIGYAGDIGPVPEIAFANSETQSTLGAAYDLALANLLGINSVAYDAGVYNSTGFLRDPPGTFFRAGGGYQQPWTRDAAVNCWNAGSLLAPETARNTLWAVVERQDDGRLIVQQDTQWWDQVIWVTAAWHHYLVTGDKEFLSNAYKTARNTLAVRKDINFNAGTGLFRGPSFFNDGIAGYPAPPADSTDSRGSFVLDYGATHRLQPLSTNALYYQAYRSAASMSAALGRPSGEASALNRSAAALKRAINRHLWMEDEGLYGYLLHGNGGLDDSQEGAGLSFAILFDIADAEQAASILENIYVGPHGVVSIYPHFARYNDRQPGRHNVIVWPMINGFFGSAAAKSGDEDSFARELSNLAALANASGQFYEIYNSQTGEPDGGWQVGGPWDSVSNQTWSATAYLRLIYSGVFGMTFTTEGIQFRPLLPAGFGDVTLTGVQYRDTTLDIKLRGSGRVISSFKIDGVESEPFIPNTLTGTHTVEIDLQDDEPGW